LKQELTAPAVLNAANEVRVEAFTAGLLYLTSRNHQPRTLSAVLPFRPTALNIFQ